MRLNKDRRAGMYSQMGSKRRLLVSNFGTKLAVAALLDLKAVDNLRTILRGVEIMSVLPSRIPDEKDRTELLELDLARVLFMAGVGKVDELLPATNLMDFFEAAEEERGRPIRPPNENRLVFDSCCCTTSSDIKADNGSVSIVGSSMDSGMAGGGESGLSGFIGT